MARKLTKKQKGFVKDYIATGNGTQAALKNYDVTDPAVAAVIATENLNKPNVADVIEKYADRIPDDLLLETHLEGLKATSLRFSPEGEQIKAPDYGNRAKFTEMGYKIKGSFAPEKYITLTVKAEPNDRLKKLAELLNK